MKVKIADIIKISGKGGAMTREKQLESALKKAIKRLVSIEQKYQDNMTAYERKYNQMRKTLWDQFHSIALFCGHEKN